MSQSEVLSGGVGGIGGGTSTTGGAPASGGTAPSGGPAPAIDGPAATGSGARARAAFEACASEMAAMPAESIVKVNLDIPSTVGTVIAKLPALRALRGELVKELSSFNHVRFDMLEMFALALFYAHGAYLVATEPSRSLEELAVPGTKLRKLLLSDARALEVRGIFEEKPLNEIEAGSGLRDLGEDLIALVNLYRGHWAEAERETGIKAAELEQAEALAAQLVIGAAQRDEAPITRGQAIEQRERAFALLLETYNEARQAVIYLRRKHGDADTIAPSLYSGRARPRGNSNSGEQQPEGPNPPAESANPVVAAAGANDPPARLANPRSAKVGMPGSSPYTE